MIAVIGVGCEEVSIHEFYQSVELDDGKYDLFNGVSDLTDLKINIGVVYGNLAGFYEVLFWVELYQK